MKNLILIFLFVLLGVTCSKSQVDSGKWVSVSLMFESGPVSPIWQYNYTVIITNDGVGQLNYTFDARRDNNLVYKFDVTKEQISSLNEKLTKSKVLESKIPEVSENKQPIGGSLRKVRIVFETTDPNADRPPKMIESPYFPEQDYLKDLNELYDFMQKLVPENDWKDAESKRTDNINKSKNN